MAIQLHKITKFLHFNLPQKWRIYVFHGPKKFRERGWVMLYNNLPIDQPHTMSNVNAGPQKYQSDARNEFANRAILLTLICNPEIYVAVVLAAGGGCSNAVDRPSSSLVGWGEPCFSRTLVITTGPRSPPIKQQSPHKEQLTESRVAGRGGGSLPSTSVVLLLHEKCPITAGKKTLNINKWVLKNNEYSKRLFESLSWLWVNIHQNPLETSHL